MKPKEQDLDANTAETPQTESERFRAIIGVDKISDRLEIPNLDTYRKQAEEILLHGDEAEIAKLTAELEDEDSEARAQKRRNMFHIVE